MREIEKMQAEIDRLKAELAASAKKAKAATRSWTETDKRVKAVKDGLKDKGLNAISWETFADVYPDGVKPVTQWGDKIAHCIVNVKILGDSYVVFTDLYHDMKHDTIKADGIEISIPKSHSFK